MTSLLQALNTQNGTNDRCDGAFCVGHWGETLRVVVGDRARGTGRGVSRPAQRHELGQVHRLCGVGFPYQRGGLELELDGEMSCPMLELDGKDAQLT